MVADIQILMPKYTKNLVLNPSLENNMAGWVPAPEADGQIARFEWGNILGVPDGFETVDDTSNQLAIQKQAALSGIYGMKCSADGSAQVARGNFLEPNAEKSVWAGLLLDLNDYVMNANDTQNIVGGGPFTIKLIENGGSIFLRVTHDDDAGTISSADFAAPFPGVSSLLVQWVGADNPGDNDGIYRFWIDGALFYEDLNVDNDTKSLNTLRFGFVEAPHANNTGSIFVDNCFWYRTIGDFIVAEPTLERARFGRKSLKITTPGANNIEGVYRQIDTTNINSPVVGSVYLRGSGDVRLRLIDGASGGQYISKTIQLHDRWWQRLSAEGITVGGNDYRMYIETVGTVPQAVTFYVDGAQLEEGGVLTSYCDGDQPGCRWNGVLHASTSERESTSMDGGEWVSWRDDECDPDSYFTEIEGFGMPPITLNRQQMALSPGSFYDSTRVDERVMNINSFFVDRFAQKRKDVQINHLYELRQRIEDLIKPDNNPNGNPFWLRFGEDDKWLMIQAHYESGMEFQQDVRNKWTAVSSIRFIAMQPYFVEDSQETALLEYGYELGDNIWYAMRIDGEWKQLLNGVNEDARALELDQNERLYMGGAFTQDDDGNFIRRTAFSNDDLSLLQQAASGIVDGIIFSVAAHPNGKIYIGGGFTQDGDGNARNRIIEYDPSTNAFSDLGSGVDDSTVYSVKIAPNGDVYCAGFFTSVSGAPANYIAYWDGGAWHTVGDIDAETNCQGLYDIQVISSDEIYAFGAGALTDEVAWKWDGSTWEIMANPSDGSLSYTSIIDNSGSVVFTVRFTTNVERLYRYNGASIEQLGNDIEGLGGGLVPRTSRMGIDSEGNIYLLTASVSQIGSLKVESPLWVWNGTAFVFSDLATKDSTDYYGGIVINKDDDIFVSFSEALDNVNVSSITYLNNIGTAQVFPIISIEGPGKILWIENQITKQIAYMNYTNQENELLEIDFRIGKKTVTSNYRGSVPDAILPNSEDIFLAAGANGVPKSNKFAVLIVDSVSPTVQLRYQPTHWSIDALDNL